MEKDQLYDSQILNRVRRQERVMLRSISWISLGIALLYVCGYLWRASYYNRLGVPVSIVDFPFPEILVPKMCLVVFLFQALYVVACENYSEFFANISRRKRAKAMGLAALPATVNSYGIRSNSIFADKSNYVVVGQFLGDYTRSKAAESPEWRFDMADFENAAAYLFQDAPAELRHAFLVFFVQLAGMDNAQRSEAIGDVVGRRARGAKVYWATQIGAAFILLIVVICAIVLKLISIFLVLLYMAVGIGVGYFLVVMSKVEARWQLWHSVWMAVLVMVAISGIDGCLTARGDLKKQRLPVVKVVKTDGSEQEGLLAGNFNDGYVLIPFTDNAIYGHTKIHKEAVKTISWTSVRKLQAKLEEAKNLAQMLKSKGKQDIGAKD